MSVLALLLNADVKKFEEKQTKKMEIPRLSAALGAPFELELQPIDPELYSEIQESAVKLDKKGGLKSIDTYALSVRTCVEGIKDPSMKDKGLMKKFGAASPNDLVKKTVPGWRNQRHFSGNQQGKRLHEPGRNG